MEEIRKIGIYTIVIHLIIIIAVIVLGLLEIYNNVAFTVVLAIMAPMLITYIDLVITFFTSNNQETFDNSISKIELNTNIKILKIIAGFYVLGILLILVIHAVKPLPITTFIGFFAAIESLAGIFLTRMFKFFFK